MACWQEVFISRQTNTFDRTGDKTAELQLLKSDRNDWFDDDADDVMKRFLQMS
jgi:hypothetical protein